MKCSSKAAAVAILLAGTALPGLAGDGQWTAEGLQGFYSVSSLAIGASPRTLFAGTWVGVLRSTEPGVWTRILEQDYATLAVDRSGSGNIYAGNLAGLFRSTDNGDHFEKLSSLPIRCLAIDPANPATLYAGTGYTWDLHTATAGAVHKSTDRGATWAALETTSLADGIAAFVLDPRRPGTIYAGGDVYYDYFSYPPRPLTEHQTVIASVDAGAEWTGLLPGDPVGLLSVSALAIDPETGSLYAGATGLANSGPFFRRSIGAPWIQTDIGRGLKVSGVTALVLDPSNPGTMYAGTWGAGVFRSIDGGQNWAPMNDGLFDDGGLQYSGFGIRTLVLDPEDGVLRAGTENGVFAIRPGVPSAPCIPEARHLCLLGGRYRATVMAQIPDRQKPQGLQITRGAAASQGDRSGSFSFPEFTGDASLPEVVVKVVDPGGNRGAWVFHASLTNLPYVLSITDTHTGNMETYTNQAGNRFCGGVDGSAFDETSAAMEYVPLTDRGPSAVAEGWMPDLYDETLSLLEGRFTITLSAHSSRHGRTAPGVAVSRTDRFGYFSLPGFTGDFGLPEVYVKMIDKTEAAGAFWLFHTGLTSLDYTLSVTDERTGQVRTFPGAGDYCGGVVSLPAGP